MARVTGPLLSFDASGSVAGTVVFSKWKGRAYVRQLVIPSNPRSAGQTSNRAMMKFLAQQWAGLSAAIKATWDDLAAANTYSPFNAFTSHNMDRWAQWTGPTQEYPAAESDTPDTPDAPVATGGVRQASISLDIAAAAGQNWAYELHRSASTGFTPTKSTAIALIEFAGAATPVVYVDSPLDPGTYYYKVRSDSPEGVSSAFSAQDDAVVT